MSQEPIDRRLYRWMVEVSESREHADGVAGETNLALPTSQIPGRTAKPTEEQLHGLHDSRVSPPDSKIGEDEEAPVRRDVFRAVQLSRGVAGGVPLASGVLELEDLRRPSFLTDLLLRREDLGIVRRPVEQFAEDAIPKARIRIVAQEPVPHAAGNRHGDGSGRPIFILRR